MFRRICITAAFISALTGAIACAHAKPAPITAEYSARCAVVHDSMFATVLPESLPPARSRGPVMGLARFVHPGETVDLQFLVRPDGSVDTGSVSVAGIANAVQTRRYVVQQLGRRTYAPAELAGRPLWSRVDMSITNLGVTRVRTP